MHVVRTRNVHQALPEILREIEINGVSRNSRDGEVVAIPEPTTILYAHPQERVLFWPQRNANPFFHLFESLYFLAGRRDLKFLTDYVSSMERFSDDGKKLHGSYGFRWRKHFRFDQLESVIEGLSKNRECRRQYVAMWDPRVDLGRKGKDLPCNVGLSLQVNVQGQLDMVVHNRSNDAILGATGANAVHMSVLQEYIAAGTGIPMGRYWQVSSNMHGYTRDLKKLQGMSECARNPYRTVVNCPYEMGEVVPTQVVDLEFAAWKQELLIWLKFPNKVGLSSKFFLRTATPMINAHRAYRKNDIEQAIDIIRSQMSDNSDWGKACAEWLQRKKDEK